jgi:Ser/Thr protein kinase RdoA (MazF antagonist)
MKNMEKDPVPTPEVVQAYYPGGIDNYSQLLGGEVNITFLVEETDGSRSILQRMNPTLKVEMGHDYSVIADHLMNDGWTMPKPRKTDEGEIYLTDREKSLWRAYEYIESMPGRGLEGNLSAHVLAGVLLGSLHRSLSKLDYDPLYKRSGSNIKANLQKLNEVYPQMTSEAARNLAEKVMEQSNSADNEMPTLPPQLIHGDPRIANVLFRDMKPFTFVDWDNIAKKNPLIDIGDLVRSVVSQGRDCNPENEVLDAVISMLVGYHEKNGLEIDKNVFISQALTAGRAMALNLSTRYLIDVVEDCYFAWDPNEFESRAEANMNGANRQWKVYEILSKSTITDLVN